MSDKPIPQIFYYRGKRLEDYSRDELIAIAREGWGMYSREIGSQGGRKVDRTEIDWFAKTVIVLVVLTIAVMSFWRIFYP